MDRECSSRPLLCPGGRLVLGAEFWTRPPSPEALRALGIEADALGSLADLVDAAIMAGFRPLAVAEASMAEWDSFESRYAAAWERWLLANPDAPEADQVRARADAHRERWLRGYRGVLGFAYLTLGVPGPPAGRPIHGPARPATLERRGSGPGPGGTSDGGRGVGPASSVRTPARLER